MTMQWIPHLVKWENLMGLENMNVVGHNLRDSSVCMVFASLLDFLIKTQCTTVSL